MSSTLSFTLSPTTTTTQKKTVQFADPKESEMHVIKRNGQRQTVYFDKITERNKNLAKDLELDVTELTRVVINGLKSGMKTEELDRLSAETAVYMSVYEPKYEILAKRIVVDNLHKKTNPSFSEVTHIFRQIKIKNDACFLNDMYSSFVEHNADKLDQMIDHTRDYLFNYFGFETLHNGYLWKDLNGNVVERPQHMWLRVATFIRMPDLEGIREVYDSLSTLRFTHASPTLFNAGAQYAQCSSCFLLTMESDSVEGIYSTLKKVAQISKFAGGVGISVQNIRAKGSVIRSTNGKTGGIIPMLKNFNETARYIDQSGKRKASIAIYLEPWHADIFDFLKMRVNSTHENMRCLDLHNAMWIPDLFMKRVEQDGDWSLLCPNDYPRLCDTYGEQFEELYREAERGDKVRSRVKARVLFKAILSAQMETGEPYVMFKDHVNRKSNHQNLGTIRGSNLCTEIVQYSSADQIAVCNLCSISLPSFVKDNSFDFESFGEMVEIATENMNSVIDRNFYPVREAKVSNKATRPIGIGIQGLADLFVLLELAWEDEAAKKLNRDIFECLYYFAMKKSCELAKRDGPYHEYAGSPVSRGILQPDMWGVTPELEMCDWTTLRENIKKYGVRNSLVTTAMPTASTSQILGNNECIEPYTTNLYIRQVLSGDFPVINRGLYETLRYYGCDSKKVLNQIIERNGSIQDIPQIPDNIKRLFKTVWELPQKVLVDMSIDRAPYIDQTQSLNIFFENPTVQKLSAMLFYGWKNGLKTGNYYIRRQSIVNPVKFTIEKDTCTSCSG